MTDVSNGAHRNHGIDQPLCPSKITYPGGVASFTFDDFPKTALSVGGELLKKYGARGTYYVSLGLRGATGELGPLFDFDDVRSAHQDGHELACHTYSHLNCRNASSEEILMDVSVNANALAPVLDNYTFTNSAFPFGAVSPNAKSALSGSFNTCRGIKFGTNSGTVDLASLASTHLYSRDFDVGALRGLIDENRRLGGWLIFYTHDVAEMPSLYGCTPSQLEAIISYAAERNNILPVRDALRCVNSGS